MYKVKNWHVGVISKIRTGFEAIVFNSYGEDMKIQFSSITLKFYYAEGKMLKMPAYLMKELISAAQGNGFMFLTDVEREDAIYFNKDGKYTKLHG